MQFSYTPLMWPFVGSLIITIFLAFYAYRNRHLPAAPTFGIVMVALTIWTACYLMELISVTLQAKTFWASAKYLGGTSAPAMWFVLALRLTNHEHWIKRPIRTIVVGFVIIICAVVFTNSLHHWYWTRVYLVEGFPESQADQGFFFWIYALMLYIFILTSVVVFFNYYRRTPALYRRQAWLMAVGGFLPLGGRIIEDIFGIDIFPKVDNVILLFLISGIFFAFAIFRYHALHIVHIAHNLVIENIRAGIIVLDLRERIVDLNPYAQALIQPTSAPIISRSLHEVFADWPRLETTVDAEQEVVIGSAAAERWFHIQSSPIVTQNNAPAGFVVVLFDITARKQAEQKLAALAQTDSLTGITNRRHFYELSALKFAHAQRYQRPFAIMMLDIDHFKRINDTYGHSVGDEVIKFVATTCRQQLRTTDLLARYGGEEFICLLDEADVEAASQIAERIRCVIAKARLEVAEYTIQLTISIGLAPIRAGETVLSELINHADQALYTSKSNGRNRVSIWQPEPQPSLAEAIAQSQ